MLPPLSQTRFKKSVTFVTFHAFYKGNLSNKLHSTVSSSAIPYLSYFTAHGWMPSGLGDLLLFILLFFFFSVFLNPLLLTLQSETSSHTRRTFLESFMESTDAKILFNFSAMA